MLTIKIGNISFTKDHHIQDRMIFSKIKFLGESSYGSFLCPSNVYSPVLMKYPRELNYGITAAAPAFRTYLHDMNKLDVWLVNLENRIVGLTRILLRKYLASN